MRDPAPSRRRTHGGTGAGALALVKPSPPKAVAGRPGFTRANAPGHNRHRRTDGLRFTTVSCAPSLSAGTASPIRNSKEPLSADDHFTYRRGIADAVFLLDDSVVRYLERLGEQATREMPLITLSQLMN
jgi:hypothetical protein